METIERILILNRKDLISNSENKNIRDLSLSDFRGGMASINDADFVIFKDIEEINILKNRYPINIQKYNYFA